MILHATIKLALKKQVKTSNKFYIMKTKFTIVLVLLVMGAGMATAQNQHEYVDLGLPSGTLWATCNVGADNPEDYGDYFSWGETSSKSNYHESTYKYSNGDANGFTKYCSKSANGYNGYTDSRTSLESSDDAAVANWGSDWCIPTQKQFQELKDKCTWTWTTLNGKNGYEVKSANGKSIFLPTAGFRFKTYLDFAGTRGSYWSLSLDTSNPGRGCGLWFNSTKVLLNLWCPREYGASVRPVRSAK